jgi:hypothetical protein
MPPFKERERRRQVGLKAALFSSEACEPGTYRNRKCTWKDYIEVRYGGMC